MSINNDRDISNWLYAFCGLVLLSPEEVRDCFAKAFISNMPNDKKVESFIDYVLSTYDDSTALFLPSGWLKYHQTHDVPIREQKPSTLIIKSNCMHHTHQFSIYGCHC